MTRSLKKITAWLFSFALTLALVLGIVFAMPTTDAKVQTAEAETTYTTKDIAMLGRVAGWYGNGNFEIRLTLGEADWTAEAKKNYAGTGDLPTLLNNLGFFDHIQLGGKTLREWGCTSCYGNYYWLNSSEPDYTLMIPLSMSNMTGATAAGVGANSPVTILEGALIPSDAYLQGDTTATVYRAGCDFVTMDSSVAYGIMAYGKTEVESVKYVQGHDGTCGYVGVSLKGDDYVGDGTQKEANLDSYQSSEFMTNHFQNKILVNGVSGKTNRYGLFNLGSKGKGYYSFAFYATEAESESITIPAGTLFPSYAMTTLHTVNGNPVYIMYQTQTDVTFYKQADGSWQKPYVDNETDVASAFVSGSEADNFTILLLENHDYPESLDNYGGDVVTTKSAVESGNFFSRVLIDDVELGSTGEVYLNVWGNKGAIGFRTNQGINASKITILAGCQIPSYAMLSTGERARYVTTKDITFVKDAQGEWQIEDQTSTYTVRVEDYDGTALDTQLVVKGGYATEIAAPTRPMTTTAIYTFTGWKDSEGNDFDFATTPITADITIIAQYDVQVVSIRETNVLSIEFKYVDDLDNWLIFTLGAHDYTCDTETTDNAFSYAELQRNGLLDNIILKGTIVLANNTTVSEATLAQVHAAHGSGEGGLINYWGKGTLGFRVRKTPAYDSITEVVIQSGAVFPSYQYAIADETETDVRYMLLSEQVFVTGKVEQNGSEWATAFGTSSISDYDIFMAEGAAIRITQLDDYDGSEDYMETQGYKQSGIRFQTVISKESVAQLQSLLGGIYQSVSFGTLIVPSADLIGGEFTHEWLEANGITYMDVESSAWITADAYAFADETSNYVSFFGSIVNLKAANHSRYFSGVGYIKLEKEEGEYIYFYAPYNKACSRSAAFVAQAAVADRSETQTENYDNKIDGENNWSPYTAGEIAFLKLYMSTLTNTEADPTTFTLNSDGKLASDKTSTRNTGTVTVNQALNGAYVQLNYHTDIDVWGQFYYQNAAGTKTAVEDFYLPKGSSQHKQFLDLFRKNGVGTLAGLTQDDLYLTKITFKNATVDKDSQGTFKFLGLYSTARNVGTLLTNGSYGQEIYVTKTLNGGGEMTVGAHLGLGGSLTYLAKSGIYEGVTGQDQNSSFNQSFLGYTKYKYNTGSIVLSTDTSVFDENRATGNKTTEAGYYGSATSSKPGDGAVNLINNYDAGRQIQQSWYANVGGTLNGNTGANGYTRLYCKTGDEGYWPYNPVQAGDCNSNPGQIIDYEVNEAKGYIYVKARAMDWAYGDTTYGGSEHGVTTKSYMENYYRLNADGTLCVNNSFVDWNGFTDMDTCDFCLVELPALYPVQTLNNFFTYDKSSPWTNGALTARSDLSQWTTGGTYHYQSVDDGKANGGIGEEWIAWANDANGSVALGMYIPNVNRFVSGRFKNSNAVSVEANRNASDNYLQSLGLMSNMQPIEYTYQSCYVQNTSYTAPGVSFKMAAYTPIEYTYVLSVNDIATIRSQFKDIHDNGKVTNAGSKQGQKVGLDAWARSDKMWTQF